MPRFSAFLRDFAKVFSSLSHEKPGKRLCPVCGSPEIRLSNGWSGWLTPEHYNCCRCGYAGPIVMEISTEENQTEKAV